MGESVLVRAVENWCRHASRRPFNVTCYWKYSTYSQFGPVRSPSYYLIKTVVCRYSQILEMRLFETIILINYYQSRSLLSVMINIINVKTTIIYRYIIWNLPDEFINTNLVYSINIKYKWNIRSKTCNKVTNKGIP